MAQLSTDQQLQFTQSLRMQAIGELTADGKIPSDEDGRNFLLKLLDGTDRQAISLKRIEADNNNAAADRDAALLFAEVSQRMARSGNPFKKDRGVTLVATAELPEITVSEGQMDIGRSSETFRDFIDKMEPEE